MTTRFACRARCGSGPSLQLVPVTAAGSSTVQTGRVRDVRDETSQTHFVLLLLQKLREAGVELPEAGKKGAGPQEENRSLKEEVKTLKDELDTTKKGEEGGGGAG